MYFWLQVNAHMTVRQKLCPALVQEKADTVDLHMLKGLSMIQWIWRNSLIRLPRDLADMTGVAILLHILLENKTRT